MDSISIDKWLQDFFSSPNRIQWSSNKFKSSPDLDKTIKEAKFWIQDRDKRKSEKPILVPFCTQSDISWYACCKSKQQRNQTIEELDSFVNTTYSNVDKSYVLDKTNPCESALIDHFQTNIIRINVHANCNKEFLEALKLYRKLIDLRPSKAKLLIQSPGRIRYNFEQALLAQNESVALNCMEDLKKSGTLDQQNQRFLEIRFNSAFKKWDLLARNSMYLRSVIDIPLPAKIHQDLIEAIYFSYLYKFELENDPIGAINTFKTEIRPYYSKIFKSRRGIKSCPVIKSFLLLELSKEKTNVSYCNALFSNYPIKEEGYEYAQNLLKLVSDEDQKISSLEQAEDAFEEENFDLALNLFLNTEINKNSLKKILYCTFEINSIDGFNTVWDYCQKVPDDVISSLPPKSTKLYGDLKNRFEKTKGNQINGWYDLFDYILEDGDEFFAYNVAKQGAIEWEIDDIVQSTEQMEPIPDLLVRFFDTKPEFLKKVYPILYESFLNNTQDQINFKPIYLSLIEIITYFDSIGSSDLFIVHDLAARIFDLGVSKEEYEEMINYLLALLEQKASYSELSWALDIAELLAIYPQANGNLPLVYFNRVGEIITKNCHRLNHNEWVVVESLAIDFKMVDYFNKLRPNKPKDSINDNKIDLSGKKIGIYTLTEQAGLRAKNILKKLYWGVDVDTNCDHASTEKLINLVKSSDIFVFAWKSSKHQAFYCVQDNIPNSENLILPPGKGSSSIINSVTQFVESHFG